MFQSTSELLGCSPDIACYAKLMTEVIVPLSATLAIEEVFESFKSDSKVLILKHECMIFDVISKVSQ
jgi:bifunctional dethiobiotin synthetase / adenosylmethionine---8-amino-7-oxononanoate aminotransferase